MTRQEIYNECVLLIAEMVVRARRLQEKQYQEWIREQRENILNTPDQKMNAFAWKVLEIVDVYRGKEMSI